MNKIGLKNSIFSQNRNSLIMKKIFRNRTKLLILLILLFFFIFCICPIYFLPEFRGELNSKAENVYKNIKKIAPELIIPPPPISNAPESLIHSHHKERNVERHSDNMRNVVEAPISDNPKLVKGHSSSSPKHHKKSGRIPLIQGGLDSDPLMRERREKVVEMTLHAWNGYKAYAWGKNELKPNSKRGHNPGIFGQDMGATIVDSMDTLYIMGLMEEFEAGKIWIENNLDFNRMVSEVSVFETNIRFIGGLLTLYCFTNDNLFKDKAYQIAQKLLPAFNTETGIPNGLINVRNGISKNYAWASGGSSILSEFGTLHLEFAYLSHVTGDPVFEEKVLNIRKVLKSVHKDGELFPNYLHPRRKNWGQKHTSIGALGDSFYEYLLKTHIQSGYTDQTAKEMYSEAAKTLVEKLLKFSKSGMAYFAESRQGHLEHKMDHLACFAGGMLALGASVIQDEYSKKHMDVAANISNTCHESYIRSGTGLGPESFRFNENVEAVALKESEKYYILRPEVIESWFYMWRLTHDKKYREWAWDALLAIDKHCRAKSGFSGIKNVYLSKENRQDDVQQSFLLAETFKYLFLIFSDDDLISLDEWVFNSEAHPLPIRGFNELYRLHEGQNGKNENGLHR